MNCCVDLGNPSTLPIICASSGYQTDWYDPQHTEIWECIGHAIHIEHWIQPTDHGKFHVSCQIKEEISAHIDSLLNRTVYPTTRSCAERAVRAIWKWEHASWRVCYKLVEIVGVSAGIRDALKLCHYRTTEWEKVLVRLRCCKVSGWKMRYNSEWTWTKRSAGISCWTTP